MIELEPNGKDVYKAFAVRMGLFLAVALYASLAVRLVERWRSRRRRRSSRPGRLQAEDA